MNTRQMMTMYSSKEWVYEAMKVARSPPAAVYMLVQSGNKMQAASRLKPVRTCSTRGANGAKLLKFKSIDGQWLAKRQKLVPGGKTRLILSHLMRSDSDNESKDSSYIENNKISNNLDTIAMH